MSKWHEERLLKPNELRIGSQVGYFSEEGSMHTTLDWQDLKWIQEDEAGFNKAHTPIILTEPIMKRIQVLYRNDCWRYDFHSTPPGERQVENNWWSGELISDRRLHLSPSYPYELNNGVRTKSSQPEFWFIWICSYGTGSSWFLNAMDIHGYDLKYFHQLQNLYFSMSGMELRISPLDSDNKEGNGNG